MNHFLASYIDALSRSSSGVLIEKDNALYYALPSLDLQVINSWIHSQRIVFPNLKICGLYSTESKSLLDYDFLWLEKVYYIQYDQIYTVEWLDVNVKELGYYTVQDKSLKLEKSICEFVAQDFDLSNLNISNIISDLDKLDLKDSKNTRFLLHALSKVQLQDSSLKEIHTLVQNMIKQIRLQGSKCF